ncbi:MAG: hypothetical protein Q8O16_05715 [Dehalococcoidia bacterium]|nr:hypothetical protein [Dehalococcoidia bacterium]
MGGNRGSYPGALARAGFNLQLAAEQVGALRHTNESQLAAAGKVALPSR